MIIGCLHGIGELTIYQALGDDALVQINHSIQGETTTDQVLIDEYLIDVSSITSGNISDLHSLPKCMNKISEST